MRTLALSAVLLVVLAACKDKKQEAQPAPAAPAAAPGSAAKPEAPALPPGEVAPVAHPPVVIKPAGGFNTAAEYEAKAFTLIDQLTEVFKRSGTNCDKLAAGIEVFLVDHKAELASTDAFEAANPTAEDTLEGKMQEKAKNFMIVANGSMQACGKHEGVQAALAKLPD
jgi:hypothetical protein